MKMPSVMGHKFSEVPKATIQRSQFDRTFGHKTTFDAGFLVPIYVDEALPGDTFQLSMSAFARLATPIKPLMDNMFMETFFFAVPYRLVWDNWQRFNGEQDNPEDSTDFLTPAFLAHTPAVGSLSDYMGIPTDVEISYISLWHRAYNLVWNEWFRDQNLQDSVLVTKDDGPDSIGNFVLLKRGKRHDYFTSCLPWPQKGESVLLPLGTSAPVGIPGGPATSVAAFAGGDPANYNDLDTSTSILVMQNSPAGSADEHLYADLTAATAATINELRQAFQVQKLLERDARGGTRYTEIIRSHFGVTSPDARLQRPEYLGGGSSRVGMSAVSQQSATEAGVTPQGNLAAFGTAAFSGHGFVKSFTEHCLLLGLVCVRADLNYQQGLHRMFSRRSRFDFYWPALAHIGEQAVLSKEIYADGSGDDELVFGYQERFAEYRYKPSQITGLFRSTAAGTLDVWHLAQEFETRPTLGADFIEEDPPIDRVIAVPTEPHFIFDSYTSLKCARPMPVFGVPGLIDHF